MSDNKYAVKKINPLSWRAVRSEDEIADDEVYTDEYPSVAETTADIIRLGNAKDKISALWTYVNALVTQSKLAAALDENAHGKISMWIALGQLPEWRLNRLAALDKWSDGAWMTYYALKEQALAGEDIELPDTLPPCPVTFSQLLFE